MEFAYDELKLTELIVHVADRFADDRAGGSTKLNHVLFFADFSHVRRHGRPITGAEYQHLPHGPAPRRLLPVRRQLIDPGDAELVEENFLGRPQHRLVAHRRAHPSAFSPEELETIGSVLDDLAGLTGTQVSTLSHEEAAWRHTTGGGDDPVRARTRAEGAGGHADRPSPRRRDRPALPTRRRRVAPPYPDDARSGFHVAILKRPAPGMAPR